MKWYWIILLLSAISSITGIVAGGFFFEPADGGRGGAVAVVISLIALFTSRGYGTRIYNIIVNEIEGLVNIDSDTSNNAPVDREYVREHIQSLKIQLTALSHHLSLDATEQRIQNIFLAVSTAIGTFVWGFGDIAASHLQPCLSLAGATIKIGPETTVWLSQLLSR
jgi:hypothetical protein